MKHSSDFNTFDEYWTAYLREHRSAACRALHYAGLVAGLVCSAALISCGLFFFLPLAVVVASLPAALGHRFERRQKARRSGTAPVWAAAADVKMLGLAATGRLSRELDALSSPHASAA